MTEIRIALQEIGSALKRSGSLQLLHKSRSPNALASQGPAIAIFETGAAAARATTLINIARAFGFEIMLIPHAMVPAVNALLQPHDDGSDLPAFVPQSDEDDLGQKR